MKYNSLGPIVVDIADPVAAGNAVVMGGPMEYGEVDRAMAEAGVVVEGEFKMGSQYHFHMEVGLLKSSCTKLSYS